MGTSHSSVINTATNGGGMGNNGGIYNTSSINAPGKESAANFSASRSSKEQQQPFSQQVSKNTESSKGASHNNYGTDTNSNFSSTGRPLR